MTDSTTPGGPTAAPAAATRRGGRTLLFSVATTVAALGLVEGAVRLAGLFDPDAFGGSRLRYQFVVPPLFRPSADGAAWRPRDPRLVDRAFPRAAAAPPPRRVFVFGESAVAGLGMSENASFTRALERRLRARPDGAGATAVNCGVVALSSRQVLRVVRDVAALLRQEAPAAPGRDVFVLHVGNNEFLELHAARYLEATGQRPLGLRIDEALSGLHLYGWLRQRSIASRYRQLSPRSFATADLRLPESQLVEVVEVAPAEVDAIVARHLAHLRAAVQVARDAGATPVLMTVATNLEWGGKDDPEGGWLRHAAGGPLPDDPPARRARLEAARDELGRRIDDPAARPLPRWEARYARGVVRRALGDAAGAREDLLAAKDTDPRARRCLSRMNEGVRALAAELGVPLVDGERRLAQASPDGITGFELLYDYVHFTPRGGELLAEALDEALVAAGLAGPLADGAGWADARARRLAGLTRDDLDVEEWLGWCDDPTWLGSRDLWKYEKTRARLDARALDGSATPVELVWAGCGYALEVGGAARARELWGKARAADPGLAPAIDRNLAWLDRRGD